MAAWSTAACDTGEVRSGGGSNRARARGRGGLGLYRCGRRRLAWHARQGQGPAAVLAKRHGHSRPGPDGLWRGLRVGVVGPGWTGSGPRARPQ
jgi:hypothetical protein